jgi:hypothetical protein
MIDGFRWFVRLTPAPKVQRSLTHQWNFPAAKFFKPSLSFREPQCLGASLDFIIKRGHQSLSKLQAISQWKFHRISRELIQVGTHIERKIADAARIDKEFLLGPPDVPSALSA